MPRWVPRLLLMAVGLALITASGVIIARELRSLVVIILISFFLSTALEPGVTWLAAHGWRRGIATGALFLTVALGIATFVALMIPLIVGQTREFVDNVPYYLTKVSDWTSSFGIEFSSDRVEEALAGIQGNLQTIAADVAGRVFGVGSALLGTVFQMLTVGLFTFYMTADGPRFRRTVCSVFTPQRQREVIRAWDIAIEKTGGYFYSRALLASLAATVAWVAFRLLAVPFALPLALWVGLLSQFVPVVGTYIGGALPALIALLESPGKALGVVIFIAAYQQVENYLLSPKITARTMSLHPAVSFGAAIAGGTLLGPAGALMALPTAATIQAFVSTYIHRYELIPELQAAQQGDEYF